jgi:hypothetical protein
MLHNWYGQSGGGLISTLWLANPLKVALMRPTFVPNRDTQLVWADVSANEVAVVAGIYAAGGQALAGKTKNYDAVNDRTNLVAADTTWGPGYTVDTAFAVVYDDSGAKPLWSLVDFEGIKSVVAGTLTIDWATIGVLYTQAL